MKAEAEFAVRAESSIVANAAEYVVGDCLAGSFPVGDGDSAGGSFTEGDEEGGSFASGSGD